MLAQPLMHDTIEHLGIVRNLDADVYHAGPGVSSTMLRSMRLSPAHCFASHIDSARVAKPSTASQLHGTLAHCAICEPDQFARRYVVGPDVHHSTNIWKNFATEVAGRGLVAISPEQHATALAQARAVRLHPSGARLLIEGEAEVSAYWRDPETGLLCRARPDFVREVKRRGVYLVDVKTYSDAGRREFEKQIMRQGYHMQAAHYSDGYEAAAKMPVLSFVFVCVEVEPPYAVACYQFDEVALELGRQTNRALLRKFLECQTAGIWPAYSDEVERISVPRWALEPMAA